MALYRERGEPAVALQALEGVRRDASGIVNVETREAIRTLILPSFEGQVHVVGGRLPAARERLQRLQEAHKSMPEARTSRQLSYNWQIRSLEGEIALAASDLRTAEAAFTAGEPRIKMPFSMHNGADRCINLR